MATSMSSSHWGLSKLSPKSPKSLNFDPEIQADRLTMPIPPERLKRQAIPGPITQDRQVFESEEARPVLEIIIDITEHNDEVRLKFMREDPDLRSDALLFAKCGGPTDGPNPYFYILHMLKSLVFIDNWKKEFSVPWGKNKVMAYTDRAIAEELALHTDCDFDRSMEGPVCMATRDLHSELR